MKEFRILRANGKPYDPVVTADNAAEAARKFALMRLMNPGLTLKFYLQKIEVKNSRGFWDKVAT